MVKIYTTSDNTFAILWEGDLDTKIRLLASEGITYVPSSDELEEAATIQAMHDEYVSAMATLQTIIDEPNPTTVNLALAIRIVQGMRAQAKIQKQILILLRQMYGNMQA